MDKKTTKIKWLPLLGGGGLFVYSFFMSPKTMRAYGDIPVPEYANWVWGGLGLLLVWYGTIGHRLRYNTKKGLKICPSCQNLWPNDKQNCSSCNAPLEPLEGFYERHPKLKE